MNRNLHEPEFPVAPTLPERLRCESFCFFGFLRTGTGFELGTELATVFFFWFYFWFFKSTLFLFDLASRSIPQLLSLFLSRSVYNASIIAAFYDTLLNI